MSRPSNRTLARVLVVGLPIAAVAFSCSVSLILVGRSGFIAYSPGAYLGQKLSFLSVMMALGMFQYKYFYDEMMELSEKTYENDFGKNWLETLKIFEGKGAEIRDLEGRVELMRATDDPQLHDVEEQLKKDREFHAQAAGGFRAAYQKLSDVLDRLLLEYGLRLALAFSIGSSVLVSIVLDLVGMSSQRLGAKRFLLVWAQTSLFCGVVGFALLLLIFVYVVQSNIAVFGKTVDDLMAKSRACMPASHT